jgi:hypothetical protein
MSRLTLLLRFCIKLIPFLFLFVGARRFLVDRQHIHGVDFFALVLFARDAVWGMSDIPQAGLVYFPGIYLFWMMAMKWFGMDLYPLQWIYVCVLYLNALLIAVVIYQVLSKATWAILGAAIYLIINTRFDGIHASSEPLATIAYLLGLSLFITLWKRKKIWLAFCILGGSLGLTLYLRQQAGLLAVGCIVFCLCYFYKSRINWLPMRVHWLMTLPVTAFLAVAVGFAIYGGLPGLMRGIQFIQHYDTQNSLIFNLKEMFLLAPPVSILFLVTCLSWVITELLPQNSKLQGNQLYFIVTGLNVLSMLACLAQYSKRAYPHYALLQLPSLIIASLLELNKWLSFLTNRRLPLKWIGLISVMAITIIVYFTPGVILGKKYEALKNVLIKPILWNERSRIGMEFSEVCNHVRAKEDLFIVLPRNNLIHWICGTRSVSWPHGYRWDSVHSLQELVSPLSSTSLSGVFVLTKTHGGLESEDVQILGDSKEFLRKLEEMGFKPVQRFETGTLYRRTDK